MTVEELKEKIGMVKDAMEENWLEDEGGMEEYEVVSAYEKIDAFEEVLEMLENNGDELDIAQKLGQ